MTSFANRIYPRAHWPLRGALLTGLVGLASLLIACAPISRDNVPVGARADTHIAAPSADTPTLSNPLMTAILAAELALNRGLLAQASDYYAQAAFASDNPDISQRAVQLALSVDDQTRTTRLLKRWLSVEPSQFEARQLLALNQLRDGRPTQALTTLRAGMPASQTKREAALASIGALFQDPSLPASVVELMHSLVEAYPESAAAPLGLARVGVAREQLALAQQAVAQALAKRPDWTPAQLVQADILRRVDQPKAALAAYQRIIATGEPAAAQTYLNTAEVAFSLDAADVANRVLSQALEQYSQNIPLRYARAISWMLLDEVAAAEADFRWLLERQPDNPRVLNALGYTLVDKTTRIDEGHRLIEQAYALEPDNAAIIDSMGWAEFRQGRVDSALEFLRRAYAKSPDNAEIAAHLGEVLWVSGDKAQAKAIWRKAEQAHPQDAVLLDTLERLLP